MSDCEASCVWVTKPLTSPRPAGTRFTLMPLLSTAPPPLARSYRTSCVCNLFCIQGTSCRCVGGKATCVGSRGGGPVPLPPYPAPLPQPIQAPYPRPTGPPVVNPL